MCPCFRVETAAQFGSWMRRLGSACLSVSCPSRVAAGALRCPDVRWSTRPMVFMDEHAILQSTCEAQLQLEEAHQFRRSKVQSAVVEFCTSVHGIADGQTHSGHATLSQYLGLTAPATTRPPSHRAANYMPTPRCAVCWSYGPCWLARAHVQNRPITHL